jgi:cytochrome d ubiquinol oxidase subunit II
VVRHHRGLLDGFFVLEGFDFGVGALHSVIGRSETERRTGDQHDRPVLGRATRCGWWSASRDLRRVPRWYATWLSALYLGIVLLLVALIARGRLDRVAGQGRPAHLARRAGAWH